MAFKMANNVMQVVNAMICTTVMRVVQQSLASRIGSDFDKAHGECRQRTILNESGVF
jgi:hypothetical protein